MLVVHWEWIGVGQGKAPGWCPPSWAWVLVWENVLKDKRALGVLTFNITEVVLPFACRLLLSDEVGQGLPLHLLPRRLSRLRDIGVCVCLILVCSEASNVLLQCLNACQQRLHAQVLWL